MNGAGSPPDATADFWDYGLVTRTLNDKAIVDDRAQFGPPGYECDLLYIACILALVFLNPGPWSIDSYRLRKRNA